MAIAAPTGRAVWNGARPVGRVAETLWLPALLVAAWWFLSRDSESVYFPPLERIWAELVRGFADGTLTFNLAYSVTNLLGGLVIGTGLAVIAGVVVGELDRVREVLDPFLQFARSVPQSALVPIVIGALGIGQEPKIYLIAFACFWPVLLNTVDGVRAIAPEVRDLSRAYRIPTLLAVGRIVLPAALPQIVAGVRVALAVGVVIMVVSELFSALAGIGHFIYLAGNVFDMPATWAGTLVVAALGYVLSLLFIVFEKVVLRWYFESAAISGGKAGRRPAARRRKGQS
ncbi:ABC transporter permease [Microbacterium album]|uniref:Nitrate ABC transporter permease n=1 Tax=Microbacterium album TaxID=2053191 RepID=A0A917IE25_9MICO|nr:ABC transporter permease [Microbacterium album]GGH36987.1 nitrate ABC transporter permease [Microbacterium album]